MVPDRPKETLIDDRRDTRNPSRSPLNAHQQEDYIETRPTSNVNAQPDTYYNRDEYPDRGSSSQPEPYKKGEYPPRSSHFQPEPYKKDDYPHRGSSRPPPVHHYTVLSIQPNVKYDGRPNNFSSYKPDGPVDEEVITPVERKNPPTPLYAEPTPRQMEPAPLTKLQQAEPTPLRNNGRKIPLETEIIDYESSPSSRLYAPPEESRYEAPKILNKLKKIAVVAGDDIEMKCTIEGYPRPVVKWFRNSIPIDGDGRISPSEVRVLLFSVIIYKESSIQYRDFCLH